MSDLLGGWIDRLAALERHYFAIDGGSGAALLAVLPGVDDRLRPADSPHHADLLLVVEPITERLLDAVIETYRHIAPPRHLVVAGVCGTDRYGMEAPLIRLEDHLPVAFRVGGNTTAEFVRSTADALALAIRDMRIRRRIEVPERTPEEIFVPLRSSAEREIATEDVVLSIGPVQTVAVGPVRLLLLMDGEQVVRAEVRSGYAAREIERLSCERPWSKGLFLAAALDPLAPVAGRTAYVQAMEVLHEAEPPPRARQLRESALHLERAASHLYWLARFANLLAYDALARQARSLAAAVSAGILTADAVVPGGWDGTATVGGTDRGVPAGLADDVHQLARHLRADRLFALRTRGVGVLSAARAQEVGTSGPVLLASEASAGDAWARALMRLEGVANDLRQATDILAQLPEGDERVPWTATPPPKGAAESEVSGPRGTLTLQLESAGGDRPAGVHWARPSAVHLALVPELVAGHTLPDALAAVASLDLSMAEADG
jgi:NADH:ubiquinone oxidoreductase subunit D/Ni,Fe-hydrogenase III small subunit